MFKFSMPSSTCVIFDKKAPTAKASSLDADGHKCSFGGDRRKQKSNISFRLHVQDMTQNQDASGKTARQGIQAREDGTQHYCFLKDKVRM